jgi:hypothetical protein
MQSKCLLFLIIFSITQSIGYCDDCIWRGEGNTVYPVAENKIKMLSEQVQISQKEGKWFVDANFLFKNTGEIIEAQVGFPDLMTEHMENESRFGIHDFKVFVDNQEVKSVIKDGAINLQIPDMRYDRAFTWLVKFNPGEIKKIRNTYYFYYNSYSTGEGCVTYILKTGALWKDAIDQAIITVSNIDKDFITGIEPEGYILKDDKIEWRWENFKPTEDIKISWSEEFKKRIYESEIFIKEFYNKSTEDSEKPYKYLTSIYNFIERYFLNESIGLNYSLIRNDNLKKRLVYVLEHLLKMCDEKLKSYEDQRGVYTEALYILKNDKENLKIMYENYLETQKNESNKANNQDRTNTFNRIIEIADRSVEYLNDYPLSINLYKIIFDRYCDLMPADRIDNYVTKMADWYIKLKDYSSAINIYKKLPELTPKGAMMMSTPRRELYTTQAANLLNSLAKNMRGINLNISLESYQAVLEVSSQDTSMKAYQINALENIAGIKEEKGDILGAIEIYEKILKTYESAFYWNKAKIKNKLEKLKLQENNN